MGQVCQDTPHDSDIKIKQKPICEIFSEEIIKTPFDLMSPLIISKLQFLNYQPEQMINISQYQIINFSNNISYQGSFENNQMHGYGKMLFPDGSYYQGNFINNQLHGHGLLIDTKGQYYLGEFKHNKADGKGQYVGEIIKYEGQFKNNLQSGYGKLTKKDEIFQGIFEKGKKKKGRLTKLTDKTIYEGQFQRNTQNGYGKLKKDTVVYQGIFQRGILEGDIRITHEDGKQQIAQFCKGLRVTNQKIQSEKQENHQQTQK